MADSNVTQMSGEAIKRTPKAQASIFNAQALAHGAVAIIEMYPCEQRPSPGDLASSVEHAGSLFLEAIESLVAAARFTGGQDTLEERSDAQAQLCCATNRLAGGRALLEELPDFDACNSSQRAALLAKLAIQNATKAYEELDHVTRS